MKWTFRYLVALIPAILFPIWAEVAEWAYVYFGCEGHLKALQPCFVNTYDIMPLVEFGLFWCKILWIPALFISGWLVNKAYQKQMAIKQNEI
jgi:hypothetical protein